MTHDKGAIDTLAFSLGADAKKCADAKKNNVYERKRYLDKIAQDTIQQYYHTQSPSKLNHTKVDGAKNSFSYSIIIIGI